MSIFRAVFQSGNKSLTPYRKKQMKATMEALGFNPYDEVMEMRCKPDYAKSPKSNPLAQIIQDAKTTETISVNKAD